MSRKRFEMLRRRDGRRFRYAQERVILNGEVVDPADFTPGGLIPIQGDPMEIRFAPPVAPMGPYRRAALR